MSCGSSWMVTKIMGAFKFNIQLCNTEHSNSLKNTTLISVLKAGECTTRPSHGTRYIQGTCQQAAGNDSQLCSLNLAYTYLKYHAHNTVDVKSRCFCRETMRTSARCVDFLVIVVRHKINNLPLSQYLRMSLLSVVHYPQQSP